MVEKNENDTLSCADKIIVYSDPMQEYIKKRINKNDNDFYKHQSVDFSRLTMYPSKILKPNELQFLFLGSFMRWHNVPFLINGFSKIVKKNTKIKFVLVGEGESLGECKKLVAQLGIENNVSFLGYLDNVELENAKNNSHIGFVGGGPWYSASVKIFEYAAAQMSVIAFDSPTHRFLIQKGMKLCLFKNNDIEDFVSLCLLMIDDPKKVYEDGLKNKDYIVNNFFFHKDMEFYNNLVKS